MTRHTCFSYSKTFPKTYCQFSQRNGPTNIGLDWLSNVVVEDIMKICQFSNKKKKKNMHDLQENSILVFFIESLVRTKYYRNLDLIGEVGTF